jgi:hypothetical protein
METVEWIRRGRVGLGSRVVSGSGSIRRERTPCQEHFRKIKGHEGTYVDVHDEHIFVTTGR